ncbi:MAG: hypothetical protein CVU44_15085 [Chloroflexi bacterium HGW-Chloroflexi-6]|nr:MAG: hypothetical protein CVU44_15085 [Chloroflexi bacterium HGW-Chloroflexi-6]
MPVIVDEVSSNVEAPSATRSAESPSPSSAAPAQAQPTPLEDVRRAMLRLAERLARIRSH